MNGENHILLQELCLVFNLFICFGIPLGGLGILRKKGYPIGKAFCLGMAAFTISQICLRIPLLQLVLPQMTWYQDLSTNPWMYGLFLGFTAGIFEEGARVIFLKIGIKKQLDYSDALSFGLGHGGIEAMLLVGISCIATMFALPNDTALAASLSYNALLLGGIERIFALSFHIGATLLIAYGMRNKKTVWYTIIAISLHTLLDAAIIILPQVFRVGTFGLESYLAILSTLVLILGICLWHKKIKKKG